MKKVISINFGGRLIHIDEDAYTALQQYMNSLKEYFSNEEGKDEIISDIEYRISEILYDKHKLGLSAIGSKHVTEVMDTIGRPADFASADDLQNNSPTNSNETTRQFVSRSKLYRNGSEKIIGGVCSGIAGYFNIEAVLVRTIFIILLFGGGFGIFIYILLWIFVPESNNLKNNIERRLFRNPDDKVFGGVAGGIANYFGVDAWIPRLIFAAPFIFTFFRSIGHIVSVWAFAGSRIWSISFGIGTTVVYFLLWWIIPEAKTVQEKMAMKGEKMDLNSIRNNIQDDLKGFSNRAGEFGKKVGQRAKEIANEISESAATSGRETLRVSKSVGNKIGEGIALAFKGFILFIAGTIAFSALVSIIAFIMSGFSIWPFRDFLFDSSLQTLFFLGALLLAIIPGIGFIIWIVRRIINTKAYSKQLRWIFAGLIALGFIATTFLFASLSSSFKSHNRNTSSKINVPLQNVGNRLIVKVNEPALQYTGEIPWVTIDENGFDITRDSMKYSNIRILIEKSKDSSYHAIIEKYSNGKSEKDADQRAQNISYNYAAKDSILDLGSHITISKNEKFRGQNVVVRIQIPTNGEILFDESLEDKWHPFNLRINNRSIRKNKYQSDDIISYGDKNEYLDYALNEKMIMRPNGQLEYVNNEKNKDELMRSYRNKEIEEEAREKEKQNKEKRARDEADKKRKEAQRLLEEADKIERVAEDIPMPMADIAPISTFFPVSHSILF